MNIISTTDPQVITRCLETLNNGGLLVFPTDTVYGLAARMTDPGAIDRLFAAKGRDFNKAIAVLVGSLEQIGQVAAVFTPSAVRLAQHYFPGALTLVVPRRPDLPHNLSPYPTVGVRMPDHPFALHLLRTLGPLATTSANVSGGANAVTVHEAAMQLGEQVSLYLDGGPCPGGVPSTVVDCASDQVRVLREGAIPAREILRISAASDNV